MPVLDHIGTLASALYESHWLIAAAVVVAAVVIARVVDAVLARRDSTVGKRLDKQSESAARTRFTMVRRLVQATILFIGVALALSQFSVVNTLARAMLASVAVLGAIVGIAARALLANFVSGIMIAFSQPVRLGDYISVNDIYGTVEEVALTYTYIRTHDNRRVVIPNEVFASTVVNNYTKETLGTMVEVSIALPLSTDVSQARTAALETANSVAHPPEGAQNAVDLEDVSASEIRLRVCAWAAEPLGRRQLAGELRTALLARFLTDGILGHGA